MTEQEQKKSKGKLIAIIIILLIVASIVLYLLSLDDTATGESFFGTLFGNGNIPALPTPRDSTTVIQDRDEEEPPLLALISTEPTAGAAIVPEKEKIKYFWRGTGHLYTNTFDGLNEERVSNVTIPAVTGALWTSSKEYAIISYFDNNQIKRLYSHYAGTNTIASAFLPDNLLELAISPAEEKIAYTIQGEESFAIVTANPNNTAQKTVFSTPIPDFELSWPHTNLISLKTKTSAFAPGFLFTLDIKSGALNRIIGYAEGLDVLWSKSGNELIYTETSREGREVSLNFLSLEENISQKLAFVTLPEKCVWSSSSSESKIIYCGIPQTIPRSNLPDEWWQGAVSFNDALWKIDLISGEATELLPVHQLDAINLFLSEDEDYLFFTNKKDGFLWSLRTSSSN